MERSGDAIGQRRSSNAAAIQKAFGLVVTVQSSGRSTSYRTIRAGGKTTIFTVGYEKRSGEELMSLLRDAGVDVLADIREKPISRVADFRAAALKGFCNEAGIGYEGWPELGSTEKQRERLKETGDIKKFEKQFRSHVTRYCEEALNRLAKAAKAKSIALLCYERLHEECHRSVVADLVADRLNATIVAL